MFTNRSSPQIDPPQAAEMNNPLYWEGCATEARVRAHLFTDVSARKIMLAVAQEYERLAQWARENDLGPT